MFRDDDDDDDDEIRRSAGAPFTARPQKLTFTWARRKASRATHCAT